MPPPSPNPKRKTLFFSLSCGCRGSKSVSVSTSDTSEKTQNPKPVDPLFSSETVSSSFEDKDNYSLSEESSSSFSGLLRQLNELEQSVLALRCQIPSDSPAGPLHVRSRSESGRVAESVAVVKESEDPLTDFRRSMLQMIVEKEIVGAEELKELLLRFLSLNSPHHHDLILRAFSEIWNEVFSGYQTPPDFLLKLRR